MAVGKKRRLRRVNLGLVHPLWSFNHCVVHPSKGTGTMTLLLSNANLEFSVHQYFEGVFKIITCESMGENQAHHLVVGSWDDRSGGGTLNTGANHLLPTSHVRLYHWRPQHQHNNGPTFSSHLNGKAGCGNPLV